MKTEENPTRSRVKTLTHFKQALPIVAILRNIPAEEIPIAIDILARAGITLIEITLNTPGALEGIERVVKEHGPALCIGAGTVLSPEDVVRVHHAGGEFIVSPNTRKDVIQQTKDLGMISIPGAFTPTEVFAALDHGAEFIKIFPSSLLGPRGIEAISAVLPKGTQIVSTGGVTLPSAEEFSAALNQRKKNLTVGTDNHHFFNYLQAGSWGVGLGKNLYSSGMPRADIQKNANAIADMMRQWMQAR